MRATRGTTNRFPITGTHLALGVVMALAALASGTSTGVSAATAPSVVISEVHPAGSGNGTYAADWFEVTNTGTTAVDITGWRMDDDSNSFSAAVPLSGVTSIAPGQSVVFLDSSTPVNFGAFTAAWFGGSVPSGLAIGTYGGSGVGLSASGDAVNLFDAGGNRITGIRFGAATASATFDNTAGRGSTTLPLPLVSTLSVAGFNGAFLSSNGAETGSPGRRVNASPLSSVDLSVYVRIGRFDLPEPTRTAAPINNLLAQEASAVTYNWDTDSLFVVGDGGTAIVQVTKTGQLIDTMTLASGGSPQGTDFYDPEGLAYVGGGRFVMAEERDRQVVLFTYVPGATLTRSATQTVKLGTFVPNIGIEGISYDPMTGGFIAVKETDPQGIFQTGIDFAAGTATNGSPTTENSINLFDPALAGLLDFGDLFALSNLPTLSGPESSRLLVLSQESGNIVNIDRNGNISSSLTIQSDPGNPLSVPAQQHEGLTMDFNGNLYVVSENGGGDFDHPQLWVYAPSLVPNQPPTSLALNNQINTVAENTSTATRIKVADIVIVDDGLGTNHLSLSEPDAGFFEVDSAGLYLKAGTILDFETKTSYSVTVEVDDPTVGATPDATASYTLTVTDVSDETPPPPSLVITEVAPWSSGNSPVAADWFEVTNTGGFPVNIGGWRMDDDSAQFANSVALTGVTSIAPGESVIFIETGNLGSAAAAFRITWFGASPPAGLQIGAYSGSGVGLGTGGDAVNLYDASGALQASVRFGASPSGPSFPTFDNSAGLNNVAISQLSVAGINGAVAAANDANEIGSPGTTTGPAGRLIISEVAAWSSGNSPVGADWFEVTNIGGSAVDITGWKMDDNSESPVAAVPLNGISSIAPGESVIFIETDNLPGARTAFIDTWFGGTAPAGIQIGSYSGGSVGLSTGGDAVNLYDGGGVLRAKVFFGASPAGPSFPTFDNAAGLNDAAISQLSVAGVNGAFVAADGVEVGSPGTIAADVTPPTIDAHADVIASAVDASGATVTYALPAARDNVDLSVAVTCAPASGGLFALGQTTVTCNASDAANNAAVSSTFDVHVVDTTPPALTLPANITTTATSAAGATVTYTATAVDLVSGSLTPVCSPPPGATFAPATTTVTCSVTDAAGNTTAGAFTVTVTPLPTAGALIRHAPVFNGTSVVRGSVQVLSPESVTLNGAVTVTGDILIPGSPAVVLNGKPTYGGTVDGAGAATPASHRVTLNGSVSLGHVVRRTDAVPLPAVPAPPASTGTRDVVLNNAASSAGTFATIRDLTMNGSGLTLALPAGTYRNVIVNGNSKLVLGVAGSTTPAVYNLQALTLNGTSSLDVIGPVVLTLNATMTANGRMGNAARPDWLTLRIASGGLTLNGNVVVAGSIVAPNGQVLVNGSSGIIGRVTADGLALNGNALLDLR